MPKAESAPATRRSTRISSKAAGPAAAQPPKETKAAVKKAPAPKKEAAAPKAKEPKEDNKADDKDAEAKPAAPVKAPSSKGAPLKLGQGLPKIKLEDNTGAEVDVSTLAAEKGVVIFLYPKADTPGCTNQACGYRDAHDEIAELGYDIYGLSKDSPSAQQKWINKKELNYKLLCDPDSQLIKKLGAFIPPKNTKRSHFVFEKGTGKLIDIALGVKAAEDPANTLKFLKNHHKA
ncbi:Peroxiredoxin bcp1 [Vanrija pseudolonga]|uniref:thioredoxin-dependent peroxiredoxin n=1 Tax=Vanrija pseudolonga TaxID=143232 RepID=A0AAF1BJF6_9TREE|nr:Peroxiredoxin bcp1 [Vanrija pseudolonga]